MWRWTCILRAQYIESKEHGCGEGGGLFFAGEVQPINLPRITPLVKSWRGLVIFQTFHNGVVYNNLLVLQFDSHNAEAVVDRVVVDVDAAEALLARFDWHPFFAGVIIDHHRGSGLTNTLFTHFPMMSSRIYKRNK